ncbi:MAG: hypothetical protein JW702_08250 [Clostridiales bacterium]|nr:hypothetical protein [Clostridiales bacterium]
MKTFNLLFLYFTLTFFLFSCEKEGSDDNNNKDNPESPSVEFNWQQAEISGTEHDWRGITSSSDGTKMAAVEMSGYVYTSANSGESWTRNWDSYGKWMGITSSSDGTRLAAVVHEYYIYTSADGGDTWTRTDERSNNRYWSSIASSLNGMKLACASHNGYIYTSTNGGSSWTEQTDSGDREWEDIASSSDGTKLAAVAGAYATVLSPFYVFEYDYIYTSSNGGATWTKRSSAGSQDWKSITSSSDGTKLAATASTYLYDEGYVLSSIDGYIYTSSDGGITWTKRTSAGSRAWKCITSSSDGNILAAVVCGGYIYTSVDGGSSWIEETDIGSRDWTGITCSSDGSILAAVAKDENKIFIGRYNIEEN